MVIVKSPHTVPWQNRWHSKGVVPLLFYVTYFIILVGGSVNECDKILWLHILNH